MARTSSAAVLAALIAVAPAAVLAQTSTTTTETPAATGTAPVVVPPVVAEATDAAAQAATEAATTAATAADATADAAAQAADAAQTAADTANAMLGTIGFYVGDERTVPVDAATAASWLTIEPDDSGAFEITADASKIQTVVDGLAPLVDRAPANGAVITNSRGTVLATTVPGADGRVLGDTSNIAKDFAEQLASGNGSYALPVEVTPAVMATSERLLEVDLSEQRLYLKENGNVVDSWLISSGKDTPSQYSPTITGRYRVNSHYTVQTMSSGAGKNGTGYWDYEVENIRWIMYFNGSQAFHGVYWHNNFGTKQSHGCIGMPNSRAQQIYEWSPNGTDVWIHN